MGEPTNMTVHNFNDSLKRALICQESWLTALSLLLSTTCGTVAVKES
ncbi:MAG: hypothetical protein ACREAY_12050 [Nitrososphaera sp.]